MKTIYAMSAIGGCRRALAAARLGYEPRASPEFMQIAAREGLRHEEHIAEDLSARYEFSGPVYCAGCGRWGEHVELEFPAFRLVGHIDRRCKRKPDGKPFIAEFKALNDMRAAVLCSALDKRDTAERFPEYAAQIACYKAAAGWPVLYVVKKRGAGSMRTWEDYEPELSIEQIVGRTLELEVAVRKQVLPPCDFPRDEFHLKWGPYAYICNERSGQPQVAGEELQMVAEAWLKASAEKVDAERRIEDARLVFQQAIEHNGGLPVRSGVVHARMVAETETKQYDKALLEAKYGKAALHDCEVRRKRAGYVKVESDL